MSTYSSGVIHLVHVVVTDGLAHGDTLDLVFEGINLKVRFLFPLIVSLWVGGDSVGILRVTGFIMVIMI